MNSIIAHRVCPDGKRYLFSSRSLKLSF